MKSKQFALGHAFPHEGFVQRSIESYFKALGFTIDSGTDVDLICHCPATGEKWIVEAKGKTSQIGLDFRTGLGQLTQRMKDAETKHALAMPDIPQFAAQCSQVSAWVRRQLRLHWLLVNQGGEIRDIGPDDSFTANEWRSGSVGGPPR